MTGAIFRRHPNLTLLTLTLTSTLTLILTSTIAHEHTRMEYSLEQIQLSVCGDGKYTLRKNLAALGPNPRDGSA